VAQNESALILTGKNISRMTYFQQYCYKQDYYKNQGDSRKIQSSGTNQERIMKPERIGNGTPPMENETPPVENERHPTDGKCYPRSGNWRRRKPSKLVKS
jgi:hypothetical protein